MLYVKGERGYPERLSLVPNPPHVLRTSGPLEPPARAVAIVGARDAIPEAVEFAEGLAFDLASRGVVVISGGAVGVDAAAHRGALRAGGTTWCVPPTGRNHVYPKRNAALFAEIEASEKSRMLWVFADDEPYVSDHTPRYRNAVLVALAEAVVVVQARIKSGSRNAATWARDFGRELWVVPAAPWMKRFEGSREELARGARPLWSTDDLLVSLGLAPARRTVELERPPPSRQTTLFEVDQAGWSEEEKLLFSLCSTEPKHIEDLAREAGLRYPSAVSSLLTLSLKDVVVEGPEGFFRRTSRR